MDEVMMMAMDVWCNNRELQMSQEVAPLEAKQREFHVTMIGHQKDIRVIMGYA